jgi:peptidoglycan/LPS O-acetylase OafA/YrhL
LAVLAVFVFHAAPTALRGGFIGVDVFFVLSGFLITSILLRQHAEGTYSLSGFYVRRIKRLLPASLALLAFVTVAVAVYGASAEISTRLREVRATVFYLANWNLIATSDDYFAADFTASPLRHMWSLAIEEQFYFVWPIVLAGLVAVFGVRRRIVAPLAAIAVASAVLMSVRYSPAEVSRVYYGTDTRIFQPLAGAILAVWLSRGPSDEARERARMIALPLGIVSCVGLLASARYFDGSESAYFNGGAVLVSLLACGLILAGELDPRSLITRALSTRLLVQLGAISYGFYLWHWPIIQWITVPDGADFLDRRLTNLLQLAATLALATASYLLLETPIRRRRVRFPATFATGLAAMLLTVIAAGALLQVPETGAEAAVYKDRSYQACPDNPQPCVKREGAAPDSPTVVLVGDSTAQAYDPALKVLAAQYGFRYVQAAVGGCPIGHRFIATGVDGELHKSSNFMCFDEMPGIYKRVVEEFDATLILATSFNETNQHVTDGELVTSGTPRHLQEVRDALEAAVTDLTSGGATFVFIDILPPGPNVACLEKSAENEGSCVRKVGSDSVEKPFNEIFRQLADERDDVAGTVSFEEELCPDEACPLTIDGIVVRYDGGHFTGTESRALAPMLDEKLREIGIDLGDLTVKG